MDPINDAYGQEILAHFNGRDSFEIIERDDGYFDVSGGPKPYFSEYDDWPDHEKRAIDLAKGRVLDIGCGAGRHSLRLQKNGLDVTGIDISPLAIRVCKLRGLRKAENISIVDVGRFEESSFDTITMMGNNFGLLGSFNGAKSLLKEFHRITSSSGMIIAESNDPYKTDNPSHLEYHKFNLQRGRMAGQLRIRVRFGKYVGDWFDYLLVSRDEMKEILRGTGWRVKELFDSGGSPYIAHILKEQ